MKKSITSAIRQPFSDNGENSTEPTAPDILDPFHPENVRIDEKYIQEGAVKKLLTTIPVRRPNKQDFIRVCPDPKYRLNVALINLQEEREVYLVAPRFFEYLEETQRSISTLYLAMSRQKILFLWPVRLPGPEERRNFWQTSAAEGAEHAMRQWVRVAANMKLGAYEISVAENQLLEPEWPELSFGEILRIAFKERLVDGPDHPVMQRLRGAI